MAVVYRHPQAPRLDAMLFLAVLLTVTILISPALTPFMGGQGTGASASSIQSPLLADDAGYGLFGGWDWESLADDRGYVDIILSYSNLDLSHEQFDALAVEYGIEKEDEFSFAFSGISGRLHLDSLKTMLSQESQNVTVYPDLELEATLDESVTQIGADQIHLMKDNQGQAVTGEGVVVAVIDTGVDYTHPDLGGGFGPGYKVIGGYDFYNGDSDPIDDNGHGTHVAGIIAANGGMKGVAPDASILAYKTLGADGSGPMSKTILAIERAVQDRADVISMSLGGSGTADDPICAAVETAVSQGVVVVVAAGNSGPSLGTVSSPGIAASAITVGAVDDNGVLADFSSRGMIPDMTIKPEISAPGVAIVSTVPFSGTIKSNPTGYASLSGTSMATPHVSGGVALLRQLHDSWTPEQIKSALISGSRQIGESIWAAGAGELWLPGAASQKLFFTPALVSYGFAGDPAETVSVYNLGTTITLSSTPTDCYSMAADGVRDVIYWTNFSVSSPSSFTISFGVSQQITISVPRPSEGCGEGYYDGNLLLTGGSTSLRIPFGFAILSKINVHVFDQYGREVLDPYGGVWIYTHPDAQIGMGVRGELMPAPPATFLVPAGEYAIHSAGHHLVYSYNNSYALYARRTVGFLETVDVNLEMSAARQMIVDLETEAGHPIYVKEFRIYSRHAGATNVSFHLTGTDYSVNGSRLDSLKKSMTVYVSDTDATVGIQVTGYSYSAKMWDFMSLNRESWYEFDEDSSTDFFIEASADLQYLMAWEFEGVDSSTPTSLTLVEGQYSVYDVKYDIPGKITSIWGDWGTHRAIGGDAVFFTRRDTETSLNPFYSGMTRRSIVQGVFSDLYHPMQLMQGFFELEYYVPDYDHLVHARTLSEIYLPDRNFITPIQGVSESLRVGSGPFYPSVRMSNDNDTIAIIQPLLRDQGGAKIGGMYYPDISLYRNGMFSGLYQMADYLARPDAIRFIDLTQSGTYCAKIKYNPVPQICNEVTVSLGFTVPSVDPNPPFMTGLSMSQRFVPGQPIALSFSAADEQSNVIATSSWRENGATSWNPLTVTTSNSIDFSTSIPAPYDASALDLKIVLTDMSGNSLEYIAGNATLAQIPVVFELSSDTSEVRFSIGDEYITLTGRLEDASGNPLHAVGGVPLELTLNGEKVGMILDEYVSSGSHEHNGDIMFEWRFYPRNLFTAASQTADIQVSFDLGIYEPVARTITLRSIEYSNAEPVVTLRSPPNGSLIAAGAVIDLDVWDDRSATLVAYLDGASLGEIAPPWDISTSSWSDGLHILSAVATDDDGAKGWGNFTFVVDALSPVVDITFPSEGSLVPLNRTMLIYAYDERLSSVTCSLDGGAQISVEAPYSVPMTGWSAGHHSVTVVATDQVGHSAIDQINFTIFDGDMSLYLMDFTDNDLIMAGTPIAFTVIGDGTITCRWIEAGVTHELGSATSISTDGWSDGTHYIVINATSDLGGHFDLPVTVRIDGTEPVIILLSPADYSYVNNTMILQVEVVDDNFKSVSCVIAGVTLGSLFPRMNVPLEYCFYEGWFFVDVTAVDQVGLDNSTQFVFYMDRTKPEITYGGVIPGEAVKAGTVIDVKVTDASLELVEWTLNGGGKQVGGPSFQISTDAMPFGWNNIEIYAIDQAGLFTRVIFDFFIDVTSPYAVILPIEHRNSDGSLTVEASVTDNFRVGGATLSYKTEEGSFMTVPMAFDGSNWIATIPSDDLWEGMTLKVQAYDTVGNQVDSPEVEIEDLPEILDPGDDEDEQRSPFLILVDPIILGPISVAAIAAFLVLTAVRRRREDKDVAPYRALTAHPGLKAPQLVAATPAPRVAPARQVTPSFAADIGPKPVNIASSSPRIRTPAPPPRPEPPPKRPVVVRTSEIVERAVPRAPRPPLPDDFIEKAEAEIYIPQSDLDELVSLAQKAVNRKMGIKTDATTILHGLELREALERKPRSPSPPG